ncbi:MAG: hypothetical protein A3G73_01680 [Rhodospirillales bacterium RIFCSPLOWO2_12_FULL_67_15]|nr:MAG: hypothetical protein A3G73_01680 [Rhodospirillales bacterium RIFCSPLOWO2_12_FULL_67_15]
MDGINQHDVFFWNNHRRDQHNRRFAIIEPLYAHHSRRQSIEKIPAIREIVALGAYGFDVVRNIYFDQDIIVGQ